MVENYIEQDPVKVVAIQWNGNNDEFIDSITSRFLGAFIQFGGFESLGAICLMQMYIRNGNSRAPSEIFYMQRGDWIIFKSGKIDQILDDENFHKKYAKIKEENNV